MGFVFRVLILFGLFVCTASAYAAKESYESKFWVWDDAIQIQLTDLKTKASMLVYMEYDAHKKNHITFFEMDYVTIKGASVPESLLQFQDLEKLRQILKYTSDETTVGHIMYSTIRPKKNLNPDGVFDQTYAFMPTISDEFSFLGNPKDEPYRYLIYQLNRILKRVLYHPKGVLVHSENKVCNRYLRPTEN